MEKTYMVRDVAPDILLFSNLGAIQLNYGFGIEECIKSIEMIDADCLMLHLNPMQEAFQVKGNHDFSNICSKIENICRTIKKPVIVREVGFGISYDAGKETY